MHQNHRKQYNNILYINDKNTKKRTNFSVLLLHRTLPQKQKTLPVFSITTTTNKETFTTNFFTSWFETFTISTLKTITMVLKIITIMFKIIAISFKIITIPTHFLYLLSIKVPIILCSSKKNACLIAYYNY